MLDNLKEKLAGFDRKRLYTAAAALIVAGAAGHIMQRGANSQGDGPAIAGSVQSPIPAAAPAAANAAEPVTAEAPAAAAVDAGPEIAPPADPAPVVVAAPAVDTPQVLPATDPAPEVAALAEVPQTPAAPRPADGAPEVTRGPSEPVLATPAPDAMPSAPAPETVAEQPANDTPAAPTAADPAPVTLAALDDSAVVTDTSDTPSDDPAFACEVTFDASAMAGAMVMLSLEAPCQSGDEVTFTHAGLSFSEKLGPEGGVDLFVPALAERAEFTVTFANGSEHRVDTLVPDADFYERIAIVWQGSTGLQLHALENGASYGAPGHVWAEEPAEPARAIDGKGGFVSVLGSTADGYAADVYSFPAALMKSGADPQVSIEAQVMENTCGNRIEGTILRSNAGRAPTQTSLSMVVPGCEAVGEYLVLHNLPRDLKIARN